MHVYRYLTFLTIMPVIVQCVAAVTVTTIAADRVLTFVLASSIVNCAFVTICASQANRRTVLFIVILKHLLFNNNNSQIIRQGSVAAGRG